MEDWKPLNFSCNAWKVLVSVREFREGGKNQSERGTFWFWFDMEPLYWEERERALRGVGSDFDTWAFRWVRMTWRNGRCTDLRRMTLIFMGFGVRINFNFNFIKNKLKKLNFKFLQLNFLDFNGNWILIGHYFQKDFSFLFPKKMCFDLITLARNLILKIFLICLYLRGKIVVSIQQWHFNHLHRHHLNQYNIQRNTNPKYHFGENYFVHLKNLIYWKQ